MIVVNEILTTKLDGDRQSVAGANAARSAAAAALHGPPPAITSGRCARARWARSAGRVVGVERRRGVRPGRTRGSVHVRRQDVFRQSEHDGTGQPGRRGDEGPRDELRYPVGGIDLSLHFASGANIATRSTS